MENNNLKSKINKSLKGEVIPFRNTQVLAEFLDEPKIKIAEAVTGALSMGKAEAISMGGRIVQGALKGSMMKQVGREIKTLIEMGQIKEDYAESKNGFKTLSELLQFIDNEVPDADRFNAAKTIFYFINSKESNSVDKLFGWELLKIINNLTSMQLGVLTTAYNAYKDKIFSGGNMQVSFWYEKIAQLMGHDILSLIEREDDSLENNKLIFITSGEYVNTNNARLTDLGIKLCEILEKYDYNNLINR